MQDAEDIMRFRFSEDCPAGVGGLDSGKSVKNQIAECAQKQGP